MRKERECIMIQRLSETLKKYYHNKAIAELCWFQSLRSSPDITYHDQLYLDIISAHNGEFTASQMADLLNVARPAVTQKINALVKKGYVERTRSTHDKRIYYLSVVTKPEFSLPYDELDKVIYKNLCTHYTENELEKFCDTLSVLSDAINNWRETTIERNKNI